QRAEARAAQRSRPSVISDGRARRPRRTPSDVLGLEVDAKTLRPEHGHPVYPLGLGVRLPRRHSDAQPIDARAGRSRNPLASVRHRIFARASTVALEPVRTQVSVEVRVRTASRQLDSKRAFAREEITARSDSERRVGTGLAPAYESRRRSWRCSAASRSI